LDKFREEHKQATVLVMGDLNAAKSAAASRGESGFASFAAPGSLRGASAPLCAMETTYSVRGTSLP